MAMTIPCRACAAPATAGSRFCTSCGAALPLPCPGCGYENEPAARFCGGCGRPLEPGAPAPTPAGPSPAQDPAERRRLTVLFSDLVGSTALSARLDPEDLREVIRAYQRTCANAVQRFQGHVARYMGDGLLVYFGFPHAHEDDAERAVRAGLAIVDEVGRLPAPDGEPLQVRVGIATGLVVVGDRIGQGPSSEQPVVGETPNLAARLQALAVPDTVVISPATHRRLGAQFQYEDLGEQALKGFTAPVRAWRVCGEREVQSRFHAAHVEALAPMVGRARELDLILERWRAAAGGDGHTVLLAGEAGIGKSRLVREVTRVACAEGGGWALELQCSPYHARSALFPVAQGLRRWLLPADAEVPGCVPFERLRERLARAGIEDETAIALIANLLGVDLPPGSAALTLGPERRKLLLHRHLVDLLAEQARESPVLLAIEDLHWADPSTIDLIDHLAQSLAGLRILILLTHRPEFEPRFPPGPHVTRVPVERLDEEEALEIVLHCQGAGALPQAVIQRVVEKTDGVPLYLEELTRSILESADTGGPGGSAGTPENLSIPDSLHDSLMARLDRLGPSKAAAQLASVLGREFDADLLGAVWSGPRESLDAAIERLVAAEFLFPRGEPGTLRYVFKHALIQDAAYESLLRRTRAAHHRHVAAVIEARFPDVAATQPEVVAQHYAAGGDPEKAAPFWLSAGRKALQANAHVEATAHLRAGLAAVARTPDSPERTALELDLQIALAPALMAAKGYGAPEVEAACSRAQELCAAIGDVPQKFLALFGLWTFHVVRANHETSLDLASQFYALASAAGDEDLLLEAHLIRGIARFFLADLTGARGDFERCVADYDRDRHGGHAFQFGQDPAVVASNYLSWIHWLEGEPDQALRRNEEALEIARAVHHPFSESFALTFAAWHRIFRGDREEAGRLIGETLALCTEQDIQVFLAHGRVLAAWHECEWGDLQQGVRDLGAALDFFRATGSRCFLPHWQAYFALATARSGDLDGAGQALERAFEAMETSGERWCEPELHRISALVRQACGAPAEVVERELDEAIATARRQGTPSWERQAADSLAGHLEARGERDRARGVRAAHGEKVAG